jgi:hypothetical protein
VGDSSKPIPPESQFVLYDAGDGVYAVMLPLVGNTFRSALWGEANGIVIFYYYFVMLPFVGNTLRSALWGEANGF